MGYTTRFAGKFDLDRGLREEHAAYLRLFNGTRRMRRNGDGARFRSDPVRRAAGLGIGQEGGYFVGEGGFAGQDCGDDVLDCGEPPDGQPGLWCGWTVAAGGAAICWDQGEKFYDYVEWLTYIIEHFLRPWGYVVNGSVRWEGEEPGDVGTIVVTDSKVQVIP